MAKVNPGGYAGVIAARDEDTDTPYDLEMPDDLSGLKVALYCWNPQDLSWERMRQPQIAPLFEDQIADERFEYDAGLLTYYGWHATLNASESDNGWYITRTDYTTGVMTRRRHNRGAWSNKENLWS